MIVHTIWPHTTHSMMQRHIQRSWKKMTWRMMTTSKTTTVRSDQQRRWSFPPLTPTSRLWWHVSNTYFTYSSHLLSRSPGVDMEWNMYIFNNIIGKARFLGWAPTFLFFAWALLLFAYFLNPMFSKSSSWSFLLAFSWCSDWWSPSSMLHSRRMNTGGAHHIQLVE